MACPVPLSGCWFEGDAVAEGFELADVGALRARSTSGGATRPKSPTPAGRSGRTWSFGAPASREGVGCGTAGAVRCQRLEAASATPAFAAMRWRSMAR